jgi:hypothetical protein
VKLLQHIAAQSKNTVRAYVMQDRGRQHMNKYNDLIRYQKVMAWARTLLSKAIISKAEYARIDTMMLKKYGISSCSIFR